MSKPSTFRKQRIAHALFKNGDTAVRINSKNWIVPLTQFNESQVVEILGTYHYGAIKNSKD